MKRGTDIEQWLKPLAEQPNQAYLTNALQVADNYALFINPTEKMTNELKELGVIE